MGRTGSLRRSAIVIKSRRSSRHPLFSTRLAKILSRSDSGIASSSWINSAALMDETFYRCFTLHSTSVQRRHLVAMFPNQPGQVTRAPEPRHEDLWLRKQPQKPAEINAIGPIGDRNLIARDKAERSTNAMNRRPIRQIFPEIISELFLRPAADCDYDMHRAPFLDERNKVSIFDFPSVLRRDVAVVDLDSKSFA